MLGRTGDCRDLLISAGSGYNTVIKNEVGSVARTLIGGARLPPEVIGLANVLRSPVHTTGGVIARRACVR